MLVASDDATSGSVIANAERISPSSSGSSHCSFCSGRAEQVQRLHVAGVGRLAVDRLGGDHRRPAGDLRDRRRTRGWTARRSPGRNRFHSPRARASAFSSSTTGGSSHSCRRAPPLGAERLVARPPPGGPSRRGRRACAWCSRRPRRWVRSPRSQLNHNADAPATWSNVAIADLGSAAVPQFRIADAARLLGVSDDTVRRWVDAGTLPVAARRVQPQGHRRRRAGRVRPRPRPRRPRPVRRAALGPQPARRPRHVRGRRTR